MAKGKKLKGRPYVRKLRDDDKAKGESLRRERGEERRTILYFKSEEMQEICALLGIDELLDDHHCFLGAVVIGKFEVVKKLLKDGHSVDFLDENHETALMHAVKHFRLEMIDFLLARGADLSLTDGEGNTALLLAAQSHLWDQDSFSGLWTSARGHPRLQPDHVNKLGYSLLHYVTKRQWGGVLGSLLSAGVAVDCCTGRGVTPLIMAASRGDAVFVQALLEAGADIALEDQQGCTALCYAIAFSLQKNLTECNRALELLLAATHDDNTRLPLEQYLQRRIDILVNPPKNQAEFSKTVSGVLVHVLTFFGRFIYSGIELLLELTVFNRIREAIERHMEDAQYVTAVLTVLLELTRHCPCCCQGLSQAELADAFFAADLPKPLLQILHRYGHTKTSMIKAVFMPLLYVCTSDSYRARTWLETNHEHLHTFYNKYMRAFPAVFLETNGDQHLEIEKRCSQTFQTIMKTLKGKGKIVTEEEHLKAQKNMMQPSGSDQVAAKSKLPSGMAASFKYVPEKNASSIREKKHVFKVPAIYSSVIQHNFGKSDFVQIVNDSPNKEDMTVTDNTEETGKESNQNPNSKNFLATIRETHIVNDEPVNASEKPGKVFQNKTYNETENMSSLLVPLERKVSVTESSKSQSENKERFTDGYQLFKMEDEVLCDVILEEENNIARERCKWLDSCGATGGHREVSDVEVNNTLMYLDDIFNRILDRYDSTWRKQFEKGYVEAEGNSDDLLKLMSVLPALENYHMEKLMNRWNNFCKQVKDHARKNHVIYAAMVSEMQLFLLEFEAKLDKSNVTLENNTDNSSQDSYIDTQMCILNGRNKDLNTLSNGKSVEYLINKYTTIKTDKAVAIKGSQIKINEVNYDAEEIKNVKFNDEIFSDSGDGEDTINSIWDVKIDNCKLKANVVEDHKSNVKCNIEPDEYNSGTLSKVFSGEAKEIVLGKTIFLNNTETEDDAENYLSVNNDVPNAAFENMLGISAEEEPEENTDFYNILKKCPPGFEHVTTLKESMDNQISVHSFCGGKYEVMSLALVTLLPAQTEIMDGGGLRIAGPDLHTQFRLFNGLNFGDVELGVNHIGMPLAVRKFEKHGTVCNQLLSSSLCRLVGSLTPLRHDNLLPYLTVCDQPRWVVFATPLCSFDLGQYVRHQRQVFADNLDAWATFTPTLTTMARQLICGLHYLHTMARPVVHGNLKPSNVLVDISGTVRLAEFGMHQVLYQQQSPPQSAVIWWARECRVNYLRTWKYECTQQSDIQTAGMLVYFILTLGQHPFGERLSDILDNILSGLVTLRSQDVNTTDLLYWMMSRSPDNRPNTADVLRHQMFWTNAKKWEFLSTCCGLGASHRRWPLSLDLFYTDLDNLARRQDIHSAWIAILKKNCECKIGCDMFDDTPSGLLKFLAQNLREWVEIKDIFLELFPSLPLNLFRMIERTDWIDHPEFEPFTRVGPLS